MPHTVASRVDVTFVQRGSEQTASLFSFTVLDLLKLTWLNKYYHKLLITTDGLLTLRMFDDDLIENVKKYPILYRTKGKNYRYIVSKENCWRKIAAAVHKTPEECKTKWRNIRDSYIKNKKKKITGNSSSVSKYDDDRLNFLAETIDNREPLGNVENSASSSYSYEGVKEEYDSSEEVPLTESPYILEITSDVVNPVQPTYNPSLMTTTFDPNHTPPTVEQTVGLQEQNQIPPPKRPMKRKMDVIIDELKQDREEKNRILCQFLTKPNNAKDTPTHNFFSSMADVVCNFPPDKIAELRMKICSMVSEMELSLLRDGSQSTSHF